MAELTRREALGAGVIALAAGLTGLAQGRGTAPAQPAAPLVPQERAVKKGRLKQSVSR
jgi:hypothetical protein